MDPASTIFFVIIIILSAIIHEYAHGWVADMLGDSTARYAGRLTLNPLAHIDPIGSILLPILLIPTGFLFAYAKPVPYNPYNLKDQRMGPIWVALAGPFSNFCIALVFGLLLQFAPVGNIAPFLAVIVYANVLLGVFNLVPIPPLDGSKLLYLFLPTNAHKIKYYMDRFGIILLVAFIFYGSAVIQPIISAVYQLFVGGVGGF